MSLEFQEFPKIARLTRECTITEKIDGTNAQVVIAKKVEVDTASWATPWLTTIGEHVIAAGSRTRYITPLADNHGWAAWVLAHAEELIELGEGRHFGEWWGSGIQRGYGLPKGEKRFSLFNVSRWHQVGARPYVANIGGDVRQPPKESSEAPTCCHVVPVLYRGLFSTNETLCALLQLNNEGSQASPGFMRPEGVIVYHVAANLYFKKTIERDEEPKGRQVA